VTRDGDYSHHFVIISITSMTEELDAVTVGQYSTSGKKKSENSKNSTVNTISLVHSNK
jgi:hypothetical protein